MGPDRAQPIQEEETISRADMIKAAIIERENALLPLTKQEFHDVEAITIDSLVFINNSEPYTGYLVTTWTLSEYAKSQNNNQSKKTVYVEITHAAANKSGKVNWISDWISASFSII